MNWVKIRQQKVKEQLALWNKAKEEGRSFTDEEMKAYNELQTKIDECTKMINIEAQNLANGKMVDNTDKTIDNAANGVPGAGNHSNVVPKKTKKWQNFGEFLCAVKNASKGIVDPRLINNAILGSNTEDPEEGGFLTETEHETEIIKQVYELAILAPRCRRRTLTRGNRYTQNYVKDSNRATGQRMGGVTGYWIGEGKDITSSKPEFGEIDLKLGKLAGLYYATEEMMSDTSVLGQDAMDWFTDEFAWLLDEAILSGVGTKKPLGILKSNAYVSVAKETGQAAASIVYENVYKMYSRCLARNRLNAAWFINQNCEPELFTMAHVIGTSGYPVYLPAGGVSERPYGTLFGLPVIPIEQAESVGTHGDITLMDLSNYLLIDKGSIKQDSSIHVAFATDQQAFRFIYRVNGQPIWQSPTTPAKGTASTLSPFVTLATRS